MYVWFGTTFQIQFQLIGCAEHLADICFSKRSRNIGQLMIDRLHKPADCLIDPACDFFGIGLYRIGIDINSCVLKAFCKIQLCVGIPFSHLHALRFFDSLIFRQLHRFIHAKEAFNLQIDLNFLKESCIVRENYQYFFLLSGHHSQCRVIISPLIPWCQNTDSDIIFLIDLIRPVVHLLVEIESVPSVKGRIAVILVLEDILIDHLRHLIDYLRHLDILVVDFAVDLLFLIRQENIETAVLLDKHLMLQHL